MEAMEIIGRIRSNNKRMKERVDYMNARLRRLTPIETYRPMVGVWVLFFISPPGQLNSAELEYGPSYYSATICQDGFGGCGERRPAHVYTQLSLSPRGVRIHRREVSGGLSRLGRPLSGEGVLVTPSDSSLYTFTMLAL